MSELDKRMSKVDKLLEELNAVVEWEYRPSYTQMSGASFVACHDLAPLEEIPIGRFPRQVTIRLGGEGTVLIDRAHTNPLPRILEMLEILQYEIRSRVETIKQRALNEQTD